MRMIKNAHRKSNNQNESPKKTKNQEVDSNTIQIMPNESLHEMSTFQNQSSLPRLPIPKLSATMSKFEDVVSPLLTPTQRQRTKSIIESFLQNDGPKLQTLLEGYDKEAAKNDRFGSYIEEFWNDAYLVPNDPLVLNVNPYFLLEGDADAKLAKDQIKRASELTFNSLKFAASLKNETIAPDFVKTTPLCMDQFKSLFGSCRIPKDGESDVVVVDPNSSHVVVMFRNQLYYFQALCHGHNGDDEVIVAVDEADIAMILQSIVNDGRQTSKVASVQNAIGVLTTGSRSSWARARQRLTKIERNKTNMDIIDSALFVLALDEFMPSSVHEAAANMLHGTHIMTSFNEHNDESNRISASFGALPSLAFQTGTCCNRYYDKLQIIVCEDGSAGINFEHSAIDGHTALRFVSDVFAETVVAFAKSVTKTIYRSGCPIPSIVQAKVVKASLINEGKNRTDESYIDISPKKLSFDLDEELQDQILFAESKLGDAVKADDTYVLEFKNFGKNLIVHNSLSPDSFVQMTMLIAYYRLYGEVVNMYESVLTKQFYHGRTEAMRGTTAAAEKLMKCWTSRSSSTEEKMIALREATKTHSKLVRQAAEGNGVDRHLYALKCIAEKNGIASDLFSSEAYKALNHTVLSTSNCGNPSLRLFGFGPVVPDGYGVGYIIKDHGLQYSISSKHRQTKRYALSLKETLLEMEDLLEPLNKPDQGIRTAFEKMSMYRFSPTRK